MDSDHPSSSGSRISSGHITEQLLAEILKRLPVKALCRFQCVCKPWKSLISSSFFQTHRLESAAATNETTTKCFIPRYLRAQRSIARGIVTFLDVIHGVACIGRPCPEGLPASILLWNPTIRKTVSVPLPPLAGKPHIWNNFLGVGYDGSKNDFKVVWSPLFLLSSGGAGSADYYEVFSVRDGGGVWRRKAFPRHVKPLRSVFEYNRFINGAIHWASGNVEYCILVLFDCKGEEFRTMELPEELARVGRRSHHPRVLIYGGLLSLLKTSCSPGGNFFYELWTMNEYGVASSWCKQRIVVDEPRPVASPAEMSGWFKAIDYRRLQFDIHRIGKFAFAFKESILLMDIGK